MASTQRFSTNLGLPATPVTNNPELWTELIRIYNAIRAIADSMDDYTGALSELPEVWDQLGVSRCYDGLNTRIYLEAAESIAYGKTIGIDNTGKARLADDGVYFAIGFSTNTTTAGIGDMVEVQQRGIFPAFPAATLTPGNRYYQSGTPGAIGAGGTGTQCIGYAISDIYLYFNPQLQF
jgi:hypothetical protein